jgi:hypothetical protein
VSLENFAQQKFTVCAEIPTVRLDMPILDRWFHYNPIICNIKPSGGSSGAPPTAVACILTPKGKT